MSYYSVKNIDTILEAVSRDQYRSLSREIKYSTGKRPNAIKNVRNTATYKQIFGNKQRIWKKIRDVDSGGYNQLSDNSEINEYIDFVNQSYRFLLIHNTTISAVELEDKGKGTFTDIQEQYLSFPKRLLDNNIKSWLNNIIYYYDSTGKIRQQKVTKFINMLREKAAKYSNEKYENGIFISSIVDLQGQLDKIYNAQINKEKEAPKKLTRFINTKDELWICISRYPSDVASMSTGQNWTSCQNLDKDGSYSETVCIDDYNWHVKYEITYGTCIAYVMYKSDIEESKESEPNNPLFPLLHPRARLLIKPYYSDENDKLVYLSIGPTPAVYGDSKYDDILISTVNNYLIERQSNISGEFSMPKALYNESGAATIIVNNGIIENVLKENDMIDSEYDLNV